MGNNNRWDRILAACPLNREAASVTSLGDVSGFRGEIDDPHLQDGPHPVIRTPPDADFINLTGQRFGRFIVLGFAGNPDKVSRGGYWSLRCDCSRYTLRRSKSLRKGTATMCGECDRAEAVRAGKAFWPLKSGKENQHGQR